MEQVLIDEVVRLVNLNALDEAIVVANNAISENTSDCSALFLRAHIYYRGQDHALAQRDINKVLTLANRSDDILLLAGKIHYSLGELDLATEIFNEILKNNPTHTEALINLGKVIGSAESNYGPRQLKAGKEQYAISLAHVEKSVLRTIYSAKNEQIIIHRLAQLSGCRKYCIDIGALDGLTFSNSLALFSNGWDGLVFEARRGNIAWLAHNLDKIKQDISIIGTFVTPENILGLFSSFNVPSDFGFLSLDIDSYDYEVLSKILSAYCPAVICVEINERIPPPIKFRQIFTDQNNGVDCSMYGGCSISAYDELLAAYNYSMVHLEYNNLFLVHNSLIKRISPEFSILSAEQAWKFGFLDKVDKFSWMPWNKRFEHLFQLTTEQAMAEIVRTTPSIVAYELGV